MRAAVRMLPVAVPAVALAAGLAVAAPAQAAAPAAASAASAHPARHGVVPTRSAQASTSVARARTSNLRYGGGVDGIGVTTGPPKVYVVVYGTQWGSQGTDTNGNATFTGDPSGMVPRVQQLLKGLGTGGEKWSNVMTQYCQGVSTGATSCPSTAAHVGYPTGGAFAGLLYDNRAASPSSATEHGLAAEAVWAAGQIGNTTKASNRNAQYVIVSPHGTTPDGFNTASGNFCAWHDWNGDSTLTGGGAAPSSYGDIAFTNLPYIPDAGASCGQNFVNSGSTGTLDGVTIVEGHEYAETITDQNPAGGWTDSSGAENGDKCAWISSGTGASRNVAFANGSFAMQSTWSNLAGACAISR